MRNKFTAMGGPDGGDGGRGAHIILKGNRNLWTLLHLRYYKNVLAEDGGVGTGNNSTGRSGKDIIIEVPLGTIARDEETGLQEVDEYIYEGKQVFLFSSPCCDQYNNLYDKDCNLICAPSGGYTGKGDNKCPEFSSKAKHIRLLWKDDR